MSFDRTFSKPSILQVEEGFENINADTALNAPDWQVNSMYINAQSLIVEVIYDQSSFTISFSRSYTEASAGLPAEVVAAIETLYTEVVDRILLPKTQLADSVENP